MLNDNSPAADWAAKIAEAYAASVATKPLDPRAMEALRADLTRQIEVGLTFNGTIWLLHANRVLDAWDRDRGIRDDTLRIVEAEGVFTMRPRSKVTAD
jgi:hypothetical protein